MKVTEERRGWHVSKEIPLATVVMAASMLVGGVYTYSQLQSRVSRLEDEAKRVAEQVKENDTKVDRKLDSISGKVDEVNQKLYDLVKQGKGR